MPRRIKAKKDDKTEPLPLVPVRYFLNRDESSHWYIVEELHRSDFEDWTAREDPDVPYYARRLNGSPSNVTFESPLDT